VGDPCELKISGEESIVVGEGQTLNVDFGGYESAYLELQSPGFVKFYGKRAQSVRIDDEERLPRRIEHIPWYFQMIIGALIFWSLRGFLSQIRDVACARHEGR